MYVLVVNTRGKSLLGRYVQVGEKIKTDLRK